MNDKTKYLVNLLHNILEQIESGNRQVVNARSLTELGEPMFTSMNGTLYSHKVVIELELVSRGASGPTPLSGSEGAVA